MTKLALITGITGQVGSTMADFLLENTGLNVLGMMRWQEPLGNIYHLTKRINRADRISLEYADLNDYPSLERLVSKHRPDYIYHLAAQSFPKSSFEIPIETLQTNIIGTANLLEVVRNLVERGHYKPVVHVCSSSEVYGKADEKVILDESSRLHGASPYSISKIGTDFLGQYYGEAFDIKTFVTRMGTHTGPRRSDVFFESTVAKQIALIEGGLQNPVIKVGNINSVRTFQDARDAVRAYYLLSLECEKGAVPPGEVFNIAGNEAYQLDHVIEMLIGMSSCKNLTVETDTDRLRVIDADYQMFDNSKIRKYVDWSPQISVRKTLLDLLNHWRAEVASGRVPLDR